jgi:ABC-type transporter Mla MlaB component
VHLEVDANANRAVLSLSGAATFLRLPKLAAALERVPASSELHVKFEHLQYIDHACLDLLMSWERQHRSTGGNLILDWENLTARFHQRGNGRSRAPGNGDHQTNGSGHTNGAAARAAPADHTERVVKTRGDPDHVEPA